MNVRVRAVGTAAFALHLASMPALTHAIGRRGVGWVVRRAVSPQPDAGAAVGGYVDG